MNKTKVVQKIIAKLEDDLLLYLNAARASHSEATHEQNKAENKYDTRGLEAAYLAAGQSKQAREIAATLEEVRKLAAKPFHENSPADLGALVEVEGRGETLCFYLASRGGGTEVLVGKTEITVLTPQSPLGQEIIGKKKGDQFVLHLGPTAHQHKVLTVS